MIRWGLLSTASINDALLVALPRAARSELVGVASRSDEKAASYARKHGISKAYRSYEALLADSEIDAVYIPLPNSMHGEWTIKAAQAGKHVLCEKPLVISLEEFDAVEAAVAANKVVVFEAFANLHHPMLRQAIEIVRSGALGELQWVTGWCGFTLPPEDRDNIRYDPALGGGSLWDVGVYPVSMAVTFAGAGAPVEVFASQIKGNTGVDIAFVGQMRFSNGIGAQISSSIKSPFHQGIIVVGSEGMLELNYPTIPPEIVDKDLTIVRTTKDGVKNTTFIPAVNPYQAEVEALAACVLDGAGPVVPMSHSRDFLKTVLAMHESAATGKPVVL